MPNPRDTRQETLIREVNERIREVSDGQDRFDVLCECGSTECNERLDVSAAEYAEIRDEATRFVIAPGHTLAGGAVVIADRGRHLVVALDEGAGSQSLVA